MFLPSRHCTRLSCPFASTSSQLANYSGGRGKHAMPCLRAVAVDHGSAFNSPPPLPQYPLEGKESFLLQCLRPLQASHGVTRSPFFNVPLEFSNFLFVRLLAQLIIPRLVAFPLRTRQRQGPIKQARAFCPSCSPSSFAASRMKQAQVLSLSKVSVLQFSYRCCQFSNGILARFNQKACAPKVRGSTL